MADDAPASAFENFARGISSSSSSSLIADASEVKRWVSHALLANSSNHSSSPHLSPDTLRAIAAALCSGALHPSPGSLPATTSPAAVLTQFHTPFLQRCLHARAFEAGLPVALTPLADVSAASFPHGAAAVDVLLYLYAAGCVLAGARLWDRAAETFRLAFAVVPAFAPSAVAVAAYKKHALCALLAARFGAKHKPDAAPPKASRGGAAGVPAALAAASKPYELLARAFSPSGAPTVAGRPAAAVLDTIVSRHLDDFARDCNASLVGLVLRAAALRRVERLALTHSRVPAAMAVAAAGEGAGDVAALVREVAGERNVGAEYEPATDSVRLWALTVEEREAAAAAQAAFLRSTGVGAAAGAGTLPPSARTLGETTAQLLASLAAVRAAEEAATLQPFALKRLVAHAVNSAGAESGRHRDAGAAPAGGAAAGGGAGGMHRADEAELEEAMRRSMEDA